MLRHSPPPLEYERGAQLETDELLRPYSPPPLLTDGPQPVLFGFAGVCVFVLAFAFD